MLLSSAAALVLLSLAADDAGAPPATTEVAPAAPAEPAPVAPAAAPAIDEGALVDAVEEVLAHGKDVVRLALPPVDDADQARRTVVELALVRAVRDRRREELVTPAFLRARLHAQASSSLSGASVDALKPFAADHVLLAAVGDEGGTTTLRLKLLQTESGQVLGEASAAIGGGAAPSSTSAASVRAGADALVEQLAYAVEGTGAEVRATKLAVAQLVADPGAPAESRLDRFVQAELSRGLVRRGFLVAERKELQAAVDQMALGQVLGEEQAPQIGKLLGAQYLVIGRVSDGGTTFVVSARLVDVTSGKVAGAASASLPRDDVVARAAVETRTPVEAAVRSAIAPGWGQVYNNEGVKAVAFAVAGYGGLVTTLGLLGAGGWSWATYLDTKPGPDLPVSQVGDRTLALRAQTNLLFGAAAVAGGITAAVWGGGVVDALLSSPQ